jgi:hypothetical protein
MIRSGTEAPAGAGPTDAMRPSSTTTSPFESSPVGVTTVPAMRENEATPVA